VRASMGEMPRLTAWGVRFPGGIRGVGLPVRIAPVFLRGPPVTHRLRPSPESVRPQSSRAILWAEVDCELSARSSRASCTDSPSLNWSGLRFRAAFALWRIWTWWPSRSSRRAANGNERAACEWYTERWKNDSHPPALRLSGRRPIQGHGQHGRSGELCLCKIEWRAPLIPAGISGMTDETDSSGWR